jgi:hypothetical protein
MNTVPKGDAIIHHIDIQANKNSISAKAFTSDTGTFPFDTGRNQPLTNGKTIFGKIKKGFLAGGRNVIHFGKAPRNSQVDNPVSLLNQVCIKIRAERTFVVVIPDIPGVGGKTNHFPGGNIGVLIPENLVLHFLVGSNRELLCFFINPAGCLSGRKK